MTERKENSFTLEGQNVFFERQDTIVSRYFSRRNGLTLLLAEFIVNYDYLGTDKSIDISNAYKEHIDLIPLHEGSSSIFGDKYPNYIICNNNDVLKKRSKVKVLSHPDYERDSMEYMYSRQR